MIGFVAKPVLASQLLREVMAALPGKLSAPAVPISQIKIGDIANRISFAADILLVEDNVVNQQVAVEYLEVLGCTVTVAENGAIALKKFAQRRYDLVLMDCHMPVMDGYTATSKGM